MSTSLHIVQIKADTSGKESAGEVKISVWSKKERTLKAAKTLSLCWGLACISILIPLLHFFLVPGFFLAGPFLALWTYNRISTIEGGMGICPDCRAPIPFGKRTEKWPASDLCTHCKNAVTVTLK
ncbi:hypothetical protein K2X30_06065 [bacterium]|nr:hypothetical protein [bacterium]